MITDNPEYSEVNIAWELIELMVKRGAEILQPIWEKDNRLGRISIQVNPQLYRNPIEMYNQARLR